MAGKTKELQRQQQMREKKQKLYNEACNKTRYWHVVTLVCCLLMLITFFTNFAEVYNTSAGVEVKVSGWGFFAAGISGNFTSTKKIYGNMAVPFYYYAADYCKNVAILVVACVFMTVLITVLEVGIFALKRHELTFVSFILEIVNVSLLIAVMATALSMKNAKILSVYCSGNPACSIRSQAIVPIIFAVVQIAVSLLILIKLIKARKYLK